MTTQPALERVDIERRARLASELATWGIAFILIASAALPTTASDSRVGLLVSAALLAAFAGLWFHVVPEGLFGRMHFMVGTAITQMIGGVLLVLTGDVESEYFVFFFLPTLTTTLAMKLSGTLITGFIATVTFLTVVFTDAAINNLGEGELELGAIRLSALLAVIALTALITRTMQETRAALGQRTDELGEHNRELAAARAVGLALARARDLGEIMSAVLDVAREPLRIDRVFFFSGNEMMSGGETVAVDGSREAFETDPAPRDSPRQRAIQSRHTVFVNDVSQEPAFNERVRARFRIASVIFIPLVHRGDLVGLLALSSSEPRAWTVAEQRLSEALAEASAPSLVALLALEEVREQRQRLADRTKVLEGLNQLVESLSLGTDEVSTARVAARSVAHTFRLSGATTLVTDPSIALLEPTGTAGDATAHAVVNGPHNCPAIRSGRVFRVAKSSDPVICPFMPFREGSLGYVCSPLLAAGEPVGALFMEAAADSVLEDTFIIAAADRVALAIANRRVLEAARRQALTDGLTGLHNRHFLTDQLKLLQSLATRHGQSYAVVAIDVDGLKHLNDTFGHEVGDLALRGFANVVRKTVRGSDVGVRTGGDEFVILIPRGTLDEARVVGERVREAVLLQGQTEPTLAITVSAGAAAWRPGRTAEQVLETADAMLYGAKRAGKNRVMTEAPLPAAET